MKQTTKNVGKFAAVALLSAAVAGVTSYALRPEPQQEMLSFAQEFPQSTQVTPTALFGAPQAGSTPSYTIVYESVTSVFMSM